MAEKVDVEISGGFRNAGLILETKNLRLTQQDGKSKFSGKIEFFPPLVDGVAVIKGGRNAVYTIKITINGKTKEITGNVTARNGRQVVDIKYKFADFGL